MLIDVFGDRTIWLIVIAGFLCFRVSTRVFWLAML